MGLFDKFKKNKDDEEELDILDEIKEPFSFDNFLEEQIVARYKRIRKMLDERGILFFLLSPFQYKNRLLLKLTAVFLGIVLGIVPRTTKLINMTKDRNAASELAQIEGRNYNIGKIQLEPLASSNYDKQHVLTFLINGKTADGVPSTVDRYNIELLPLRGVEDPHLVKYSYNIIPIDNEQRMLVMYVDNRGHEDDTGIYGLTVEIANDPDVPTENILEIILSDTQETNSLFDANGLDLAILTDVFISKSYSSDTIEEAEDKLKTDIDGYGLMVDRLVADGYEVDTDHKAMNEYVDKHKILSGLDDKSTVRALPDNAKKIEELKGNSKDEIKLELEAIIGIGGTKYSTEIEKDLASKGTQLTQTDQQALIELSELQGQVDIVIASLVNVNNIRKQKYDNLIDLQRILDRDLNPENFPVHDIVGEMDEEGIKEEVDEEIKEEKDKLPDMLGKPEDEQIPSSGDSKSD